MRFSNGKQAQAQLAGVVKIFWWGYRCYWRSRVESRLTTLMSPLIQELTRDDRLEPNGSLILPAVFIGVVVANLTVLRKMATRATYVTADSIIARREGGPGSLDGTDIDSNPREINAALVFLEFIAREATIPELSLATGAT